LGARGGPEEPDEEPTDDGVDPARERVSPGQCYLALDPDRGYTYVPFLVPLPIARELLDHYRQGAAEAGRQVTPDNLGFMLCAVAVGADAQAKEAGRYFQWRIDPTLRARVEYFAPPGIRSRAGQAMALRTHPCSLSSMPYEELVAADLIVAGTPAYLIDRFAQVQRELGIGHLLLQGHESRMDHPTTLRSIELIGARVIPALTAA
jgi:alkanesulfonate monooxygenase SsuD/methylene tetrahydromethanopterin reductase-like flavin-dependent oxidoreductase (luciferase family)